MTSKTYYRDKNSNGKWHLLLTNHLPDKWVGWTRCRKDPIFGGEQYCQSTTNPPESDICRRCEPRKP